VYPALLGIFTLPPGTAGIPTLPSAGEKNLAFHHFNRHRKTNLLVQMCQK